MSNNILSRLKEAVTLAELAETAAAEAARDAARRGQAPGRFRISRAVYVAGVLQPIGTEVHLQDAHDALMLSSLGKIEPLDDAAHRMIDGAKMVIVKKATDAISIARIPDGVKLPKRAVLT